jgi:hypothetical protein
MQLPVGVVTPHAAAPVVPTHLRGSGRQAGAGVRLAGRSAAGRDARTRRSGRGGETLATPDGGVKDDGVQIGAVRPHDRAQLGIDAHRSEDLRRLERLEDTLEAYQALEIDIALDSIAESQMKRVRLSGLDMDDVYQHAVTPAARSS